VAGALEDSGVSPRRITAKGFGERYPVAPNRHSDGVDNPSGRAKNRRVEVIIENK
jgi:outer membrane protein OmpA-like peptidoglycan-associated protein